MTKTKQVTLPSGAKVSIPDDGKPFEILKFPDGEGVQFGGGARVTFRDAPTARQRAAPPPVSAETIATGVVKVVGPILKAQRERLDALEARIRELEKR